MCVPPTWSFPNECDEHYFQEFERGENGSGSLGFNQVDKISAWKKQN